MDALSDVLQAIRLDGAVYINAEFTAPWCVHAKFGLHSALGLMKAAALAPDAILLPTDFDAYRKYSRLFKAAVREIAPRIEDRGIDEIYVDLTHVQPPGADNDLPLSASRGGDWGDGRDSPRAEESWGEGSTDRESETDAWWRALIGG